MNYLWILLYLGKSILLYYGHFPPHCFSWWDLGVFLCGGQESQVVSLPLLTHHLCTCLFSNELLWCGNVLKCPQPHQVIIVVRQSCNPVSSSLYYSWSNSFTIVFSYSTEQFISAAIIFCNYFICFDFIKISDQTLFDNILILLLCF